jgi:Fe-S-cluster containining protein
LKTLLDNWHDHLRGILDRNESDLPFERLLFQSQADPAYGDTLANWSKMPPEARVAAWENLKSLSEKGKEEMLPICVRCGACCRNGSPTLTEEDLALVESGQIPLESLTTIHAGEPVHSRVMDKVFYLPEEKVKIVKHTGTKICGMYEEETHGCMLHPHKPAQCRAQACWDPALAAEQAMAPALTRKQILNGAAGLWTIIEAHEERASFTRLVEGFDALAAQDMNAVSEILEILAFDEHVREFAMANLSIPAEALMFVFGRPLSERVHLFGFRVEREADGTNVLLPLETAAEKA